VELPPYAALLPLSLLAEPEGLDQGLWRAISFRLPEMSLDPEPAETLEWTMVLHRGAKLQPGEADRLEHILGQFEGDLWLRSLLLGYYLLHDRRAADRSAALKHILWIIENAGAFPIAARGGILICLPPHASDVNGWHRWISTFGLWNTLSASKELNADLSIEYLNPIKESWNRALAVSPGDARIIERAAEFFLLFDRVKSGRLLREARNLEPNSARWSECLAMLYQHEMQSRRDESRPDWGAMAAAEWERALLLCTDDSRGCRMLCQASTCALEARDFEKARFLAQKLVDGSYDSWAAEQTLHFGHQLLGRIALECGDVERAKAHLFESIATTGSGYLLAVGPRARLAKELLRRGETEVVLKYFRRCSELSVGRRDEFATWADQIERGQTPDIRSEP